MRRRLRRAVRKRTEGQRVAVRRSPKSPQLSVVVAVHNAGPYLEDCLRSLLSQSLTRLEVIAVDGGSTDGSLHILRQFAALDQRVKVISLPDNGLAAARNAGIQQARGVFLTFVNPQDTVPRNAFALMVHSLRRSGSDFVVGAVQRVRNGRRMRPQWVVNVHQLDRISTTIDEFPAAMQDLAIFNRVFRTAFWHEQVGPFAEDSEHKDLLLTVTAYLRAASFDILTAVTYRWHRRSDHASIVQERYDRTTMDERLPVLAAAWEVISTSTSEAVAGAWLGGVLDTDLGAYLEYATTGDDAYRSALQAIARHFFDLATPMAWEHVRVDRRLRVWLAVQGRWSVLEQCMEFFRLNGVIPTTRVSGGRVTADIPFSEALGDDTPDICLELASSQTALSACIERAFWDKSGCLVVEGWAFIRGVDLTETTPDLEATLVEPVSGSQLCVPLEPLVLPEATRWANQPNQNFDTSGFRLTIDVAALPSIDPEAGVRRWTLQMRNRTHGVERTGPVRTVIRSGMALRMRARDLTAADDPVRFVPLADFDLGFSLQVRPDRIRAVHLSS
ncbi:MAG: glycosyltransferase family 2 protein, partial [Propionibacteriaceae bacterium]|nr:glycosyltransferase family 2 protein [Propionibacteriaceae bacterium]